MEGLRSMPKIRNPPQNQPFSALQTALISCFKLPGKDTITIQSAAKASATWYNWKESHSEQFIFCVSCSFFDCSESDTFLKNYTTSKII